MADNAYITIWLIGAGAFGKANPLQFVRAQLAIRCLSQV